MNYSLPPSLSLPLLTVMQLLFPEPKFVPPLTTSVCVCVSFFSDITLKKETIIETFRTKTFFLIGFLLNWKIGNLQKFAEKEQMSKSN